MRNGLLLRSLGAYFIRSMVLKDHSKDQWNCLFLKEAGQFLYVLGALNEKIL